MSEQRAQRVGEAIKAELSDLIRTEIKDPRVGFVSLVKVEVTNDLRHAKVFFSVLGSKDEQKASLKGLQSALGYLRSELGRRIQLRHIPELELVPDDSIAHGVRIAKLLHDVLPGGSAPAEAGEAEGASEAADAARAPEKE